MEKVLRCTISWLLAHMEMKKERMKIDSFLELGNLVVFEALVCPLYQILSKKAGK